jgi:8-oxo-dGTP diphosphatase
MALRTIAATTSPGGSCSANPMYHFNQQQQFFQIPILSSFTQQQQLHHHRRRGGLPSRDTVLYCSLMINVILFLALLVWTGLTLYSDPSSFSSLHGQERTWNGGHPASSKRQGSCWCGKEDGYCLCTPSLAIDLIITSSSSSSSSSRLETNQNQNNKKDNVQPVHHRENHHDTYSFWLVRRKDTDQLATMGGFVDVNETVEHAIQRELKEEMNIDLNNYNNNNNNNKIITPRLVGVYSDPRRDNRRRTVSLVYAVHFDNTADDNNNNNLLISPKAGDDAKEIVSISIHDVEQHSFFADHRTILLDYRTQWIYGEPFQENTEGDFASDIVRSTCRHDSLS